MTMNMTYGEDRQRHHKRYAACSKLT